MEWRDNFYWNSSSKLECLFTHLFLMETSESAHNPETSEWREPVQMKKIRVAYFCTRCMYTNIPIFVNYCENIDLIFNFWFLQFIYMCYWYQIQPIAFDVPNKNSKFKSCEIPFFPRSDYTEWFPCIRSSEAVPLDMSLNRWSKYLLELYELW